jgi:nucleotide-binding universal stress UspA family protein
MYTKVIWATDGSEGADLALQEALRLADLSGASIVAVHCDQRLQGRAAGYPVLADEEDIVPKLRRQLDELKADGTDVELVIRHSHKKPADVVASVASELGGDIIVCGTRGLGAVSGVLLGSFTPRLLHVARCPVLAVRTGAESESVHAHATTTKVAG